MKKKTTATGKGKKATGAKRPAALPALLPFTIHTREAVHALPCFDCEDEELFAPEWAERVCSLAEAALAVGLAIAIPVKPSMAVETAAMVLNGVGDDCLVKFDPDGEQLLIWDRKDRKVWRDMTLPRRLLRDTERAEAECKASRRALLDCGKAEGEDPVSRLRTFEKFTRALEALTAGVPAEGSEQA